MKSLDNFIKEILDRVKLLYDHVNNIDIDLLFDGKEINKNSQNQIKSIIKSIRVKINAMKINYKNEFFTNIISFLQRLETYTEATNFPFKKSRSVNELLSSQINNLSLILRYTIRVDLFNEYNKLITPRNIQAADATVPITKIQINDNDNQILKIYGTPYVFEKYDDLLKEIHETDNTNKFIIYKKYKIELIHKYITELKKYTEYNFNYYVYDNKITLNDEIEKIIKKINTDNVIDFFINDNINDFNVILNNDTFKKLLSIMIDPPSFCKIFYSEEQIFKSDDKNTIFYFINFIIENLFTKCFNQINNDDNSFNKFLMEKYPTVIERDTIIFKSLVIQNIESYKDEYLKAHITHVNNFNEPTIPQDDNEARSESLDRKKDYLTNEVNIFISDKINEIKISKDKYIFNYKLIEIFKKYAEGSLISFKKTKDITNIDKNNNESYDSIKYTLLILNYYKTLIDKFTKNINSIDDIFNKSKYNNLFLNNNNNNNNNYYEIVLHTPVTTSLNTQSTTLSTTSSTDKDIDFDFKSKINLAYILNNSKNELILTYVKERGEIGELDNPRYNILTKKNYPINQKIDETIDYYDFIINYFNYPNNLNKKDKKDIVDNNKLLIETYNLGKINQYYDKKIQAQHIVDDGLCGKTLLKKLNNFENIIIIGNGQSGSGKTSTLISLYDKSGKKIEGVFPILAKKLISGNKNFTFKIAELKIINIYLKLSDKLNSDTSNINTLEYDDYYVYNIKLKGIEAQSNYLFINNGKNWILYSIDGIVVKTPTTNTTTTGNNTRTTDTTTTVNNTSTTVNNTSTAVNNTPTTDTKTPENADVINKILIKEISNIKKFTQTTIDDILAKAFDIREIEPTKNNPNSSRSHIIACVTFKGIDNADNIQSSSIVICDLAGVEDRFPCKTNDLLISDENYITASKKYKFERKASDGPRQHIYYDNYFNNSTIYRENYNNDNSQLIKNRKEIITKGIKFIEQYNEYENTQTNPNDCTNLSWCYNNSLKKTPDEVRILLENLCGNDLYNTINTIKDNKSKSSTIDTSKANKLTKPANNSKKRGGGGNGGDNDTNDPNDTNDSIDNFIDIDHNEDKYISLKDSGGIKPDDTIKSIEKEINKILNNDYAKKFTIEMNDIKLTDNITNYINYDKKNDILLKNIIKTFDIKLSNYKFLLNILYTDIKTLVSNLIKNFPASRTFNNSKTKLDNFTNIYELYTSSANSTTKTNKNDAAAMYPIINNFLIENAKNYKLKLYEDCIILEELLQETINDKKKNIYNTLLGSNNNEEKLKEDKLKLKKLIRNYIRYTQIEFNCKIRRQEGYMINTTLMEMQKFIGGLLFKSAKNRYINILKQNSLIKLDSDNEDYALLYKKLENYNDCLNIVKNNIINVCNEKSNVDKFYSDYNTLIVTKLNSIKRAILQILKLIYHLIYKNNEYKNFYNIPYILINICFTDLLFKLLPSKDSKHEEINFKIIIELISNISFKTAKINDNYSENIHNILTLGELKSLNDENYDNENNLNYKIFKNMYSIDNSSIINVNNFDISFFYTYTNKDNKDNKDNQKTLLNIINTFPISPTNETIETSETIETILNDNEHSKTKTTNIIKETLSNINKYIIKIIEINNTFINFFKNSIKNYEISDDVSPLLYTSPSISQCIINKNKYNNEYNKFYEKLNTKPSTKELIFKIITSKDIIINENKIDCFNVDIDKSTIVIFTVINLINDNIVNNPPTPPFININKIKLLYNIVKLYSIHINNKYREIINNFTKIFYNYLILYPFYKNFESDFNFLTTLYNIKNNNDYILNLETLINLIDSNNATTLLGTVDFDKFTKIRDPTQYYLVCDDKIENLQTDMYNKTNINEIIKSFDESSTEHLLKIFNIINLDLVNNPEFITENTKTNITNLISNIKIDNTNNGTLSKENNTDEKSNKILEEINTNQEEIKTNQEEIKTNQASIKTMPDAIKTSQEAIKTSQEAITKSNEIINANLFILFSYLLTEINTKIKQ